MEELSHLFTTPSANPSAFLTRRELQVLQLLASGLQNKEIAATLCLSDHTVATHVKSILSKLGARNRLMAARIGLDLGLIDLKREREREREREKIIASDR